MLIHDLGPMKIVPALLLLLQLRCSFMNFGPAADDSGGAPLSRTADFNQTSGVQEHGAIVPSAVQPAKSLVATPSTSIGDRDKLGMPRYDQRGR